MEFKTKWLFLLGLILLMGCAQTGQNTQTSLANTQISTQKSECESYNDDPLRKVNYDFWDVETNSKIDKCLKTSSSIEFTQITDDTYDQNYPSVYGNYVVWEDYTNEKGDIYLYDIEKGQTKQITDYEGEDFKPSVRKGTVLYHRQYEGDAANKVPKTKGEPGYWTNDLVMYDIHSDKFIQLSNFGFNLGTIPKNNFFGDFVKTNLGIYDVRDKINRDPNRIITLKSFNPGGGGSFPIDSNGEIKTVSFSQDVTELRVPIKFVPQDIQMVRKRNWENPVVGYGGVMIMDDPTPPKIISICNANKCDDLERDPSVRDCIPFEEVCNGDTSLFGSGYTFHADGYVSSGLNILRINDEKIFKVRIPFKQIKDDIALDYGELRWGLPDLKYTDFSQNPPTFGANPPKEVLSHFDPVIGSFSICLQKHTDAYGNQICDIRRDMLRVYDFKKDKFYTIKGSLWEATRNELKLIEKGDFTDEIGGDLEKNENFDFNGNKIVWIVENEKVVNGISFMNNDIKLAVIE